MYRVARLLNENLSQTNHLGVISELLSQVNHLVSSILLFTRSRGCQQSTESSDRDLITLVSTSCGLLYSD
jgi:hypothetical protein